MQRNGATVRRLQTWLRIVAGLFAVGLASPSHAVTEIHWWHAMPGQLGKQLEKLAAEFNASQQEFRVMPTYKGSYTETVTAAIFAFRSRNQPAIVQVNEIATASGEQSTGLGQLNTAVAAPLCHNCSSC